MWQFISSQLFKKVNSIEFDMFFTIQPTNIATFCVVMFMYLQLSIGEGD